MCYNQSCVSTSLLVAKKRLEQRIIDECRYLRTVYTQMTSAHVSWMRSFTAICQPPQQSTGCLSFSVVSHWLFMRRSHMQIIDYQAYTVSWFGFRIYTLNFPQCSWIGRFCIESAFMWKSTHTPANVSLMRPCVSLHFCLRKGLCKCQQVVVRDVMCPPVCSLMMLVSGIL